MKMTMINVALFALLVSSAIGAAEWKPATGPLKTRWAKDVSPDNALPEYPRPQLVRKEWQNLNGLWDISADGKQSEQPVHANTNLLSVITAPWQGKILVPFAIESALSGVMKSTDRMTYRRSFEIPKAWNGQHVLLHFGAVDWEAKVTLNGKELGSHRGGYDPFSFDITAALKPEGAQELTVEVFDPTNNKGYPRGKQTLTPGSIKYTPCSGIWQTVWLEPVAESHIDSLQLIPDLDNSCLRLKVVGSGAVEAVASDNGKEVAHISGAAGSELKLAISNPKLWSPDTPHLYDLSVTLKTDGKVVDQVTSYFGMRKIALGKDEKGVTRVMLNNKVVFQVGPLDQGFWPDGIYTAPTDEALRFDIVETKRLGFNTTRKHVKVEPSRWYYWCDKLGLMVWQDMPCSNSYTDKPQPIDKSQFKTELVNMVTSFWNHPSIIMWVVFNENQGQHDTEALTVAVKELDPSRLVNNASGNDDKNCGDVIDKHTYPVPDSPKPEEKRAAVLGEFGGLGLPVEGHRWTAKFWGYKGTKNSEDLTMGYEKLLIKAWEQHAAIGLSAVIYTQLTDVETECNGLLTYDREVNKVIPERAVAANTGKLLAAEPKAEKSTTQTILFLGDSITAAGGYVRVIQAELAKQGPSNAWKVVNHGKSSETLSNESEAYHPGRRPCLFARLNKELADTKPDWVVACYGINDGIYHPFSKQRFEAYQAGVATLIKTVQASGARLVLLTAPPYARPGPAFPQGTSVEDAAKLLAKANAEAEAEAAKDPRKFGYRSPYAYYDTVMAQYATWLLTLNGKDGVHVVDLRTPMLPRLKETHDGDPIHPNKTGHELMAKAFLDQWPTITKKDGK